MFLRLTSIVLLSTLALSTPAAELFGREWTTRDGLGRLEAELVDADATHAVLKRASDGRLFRVPLSRLSLGDVKYVREAMQAAGAALPEESNSPAAAESEGVEDASSSTKPPPRRRSRPPVADPSQSGWQVQPDPSPSRWKPSRQLELRIPIPTSFGRDDCVFSPAGSQFVVLGSNDQPGSSRELWDLRQRRRVGMIRDQILGINKLALSVDGRRLAVFTPQSAGKIDIWSLTSGRRERQLELGNQFSAVYGLDFAGSDRLVAALPLEKGFQVWDVGSGEAIAKVDVFPVPMSGSYTVSAGGSYLAVHKDNRIQMFDLRNGAFAGDLPVPAEDRLGPGAVTAMAFSNDGQEFAVLAGRHPNFRLLCWSLESGQLASQHTLNDQLPRNYSAATTAPGPGIEWIPDGRGWLLLGKAFVDREHGGPVWVAEDSPGSIGVQRRVVDEHRMLVAHGGVGNRALELVRIPWDEIHEGQRKVAAGGTTADIGLPDVTPADWSQVQRGSLALAGDARYQPADGAGFRVPNAKVRPTDRGFAVKRVLFSGPEAQSVVMAGDAPSAGSFRPELAGSSGQTAEVFDLSSGRRQSRFELPFPAELIDFSLSGRLGLFRDLQTKDRLDIFDLRDQKHVVALRPYQGRGEQFARQVTWAALVDDQHLLTLSQGGELVRWSLPDCRAEFVIPVGPFRVFLDGQRHYFAVAVSGALLLVDGRTGEACRRLLLPPSDTASAVTAASFRADGQRVAALLFEAELSRLLVWDVENPQPLCDIPLPFRCFHLGWTGADHVLLDSLEPRGDGSQQMTLVDAAAQRVVWKYNRPLGSLFVPLSADQLWCLMPEAGASRTLVFYDLPDRKAGELIATTPAPKPLFGPESRVALKIKVGGMPADLDDRRRREDDLLRNLRQSFQEQLRQRGILVDDTSDITLNVSIKNLTQDDIILLGTRHRRSAVVFSTQTVQAHVSIESGRELVLWSKEEYVNEANVSATRPPQGMSLSTFLRLQQWEQAKRWCLSLSLPQRVYHPDAYLGVGESTLTASGVHFLQRIMPPR